MSTNVLKVYVYPIDSGLPAFNERHAARYLEKMVDLNDLPIDQPAGVTLGELFEQIAGNYDGADFDLVWESRYDPFTDNQGNED